MEGKNRKYSGRKSLRYRGTQCLNCGHPLDRSDVYCPQCSQMNSTKPLDTRDFFTEFINSILVYDSRLRNTLKDLLFKPGVMSKNFISGKRLKYANPFRFFLSVSIIFFLVQGLVEVGNISENRNAFNFSVKTPTAPLDSILSEFPIRNHSFTTADSIKASALNIPWYLPEKTLDTLPYLENLHIRSYLYMHYYFYNETQDSKTALQNLGHKDNFGNNWLYDRAITWNKILYDPNSFINYVMGKIPFFLFFFTPFYALFFWLLYWRKKFTYMEHMIFIFHIFSFLFLAMLIFLLPDLITANLFTKLLFLLIGPLYFYLALKKFYGQGRLLTLIKFVILSIIFTLGFLLAIIVFVAASAAIY